MQRRCEKMRRHIESQAAATARSRSMLVERCGVVCVTGHSGERYEIRH